MPVVEYRRRLLMVMVAILLTPLAVWADATGPALVFSVKAWEGDYASSDVAGGVQTTPTLGAIYTIHADGSGLNRLVPPGPNTDYPTASPDGRWIYFQSKMTGASQIYRCKWDGTGVTSLTAPNSSRSS